MIEQTKKRLLETKFEQWSKEGLIEFIQYFKHNMEKEFLETLDAFEEWERGN